jgi:tetratricopeptide (TPR) repeat protein
MEEYGPTHKTIDRYCTHSIQSQQFEDILVLAIHFWDELQDAHKALLGQVVCSLWNAGLVTRSWVNENVPVYLKRFVIQVLKHKRRLDFLEGALEQMESGRYEDMRISTLEHLARDKRDAEAWKLLGVAYGNLDQPSEAKRALLTAIYLDPEDQYVVCNYIAACFHSQDAKSGLEGISIYFSEMKPKARKILCETIQEALRNHLIKVSDLPEEVIEAMA